MSTSSDGGTTLPTESVSKARESNIVRGITSLSAQNIGTSTLGFVFLGVILRLLPGTEYGVYSATSISVGIATTLSTMGLQYASARYLSFLGAKNSTRSSIVAKRIMLLAFVIASVATLAFEMISTPLSLYFTKSPRWTFAFTLSGFWLFSSSISLVLQGMLQGFRKYVSLAKILFFSRFSMACLSTLMLTVYRSVSIAIAAWIGYSVMVSIWIGILLIQSLSRKTKETEEGIPGYSQIMKYSFPLGVSGLLTIITFNADLLVVGGYLSSATLGVYNIAVAITSILTYVLVTPLVTAFLPELSIAMNISQLSNGFRLALRFVMLAILPASLIIAAMPRQMLLLFSGGGAYMIGTEPLQIISLFYVFLAMQTVIFALLQATSRTREILVVNIVTTLLDLTISIATVPHLGLMGAAIARDSTVVFGMVCSLLAARRFITTIGPKAFYIRAAICGVLPFLGVKILSTYISQSLITILPYSIIGLAIFLICLRTLRIISEEDRALGRHIVPAPFRAILAYLRF
jgi:O-antigen/teichoic acid export membrane protein